MIEIKLARGVWQFREQDTIGAPGGFGEVFRGEGTDGPVAIKRLKITADAAAHRELSIGTILAGRDLAHVVPVLDCGQDANSERYYLVMPVCECSLQDRIAKGGPLSWEEARAVVLDVISGLEEVGDIVHRDLKPANILYHDGHWKIADFGIAKFVEDSTSLETLRQSLTPTYAAPEQWLGERPVRATDIYALGCILHAMINGRPPFLGSLDDVREAHLRKEPPPLSGVDPRLESFARLMLRKTSTNRPSLDRCKAVMSAVIGTPMKARNEALASAAAKIAQEELAAEAASRAQEDARLSRMRSAEEANSELIGLLKRLFDEIVATSGLAVKTDRSVKLGSADLAYDRPLHVEIGHSPAGWDILSATVVRVGGLVNRVAYSDPPSYKFSATLMYARPPNDANYRWMEVSFHNFVGGTMNTAPVALLPASREFQLAFSNVVSGWQKAFGPTPIDAEDEDAFAERWIKLFTRAVNGRLLPPTSLPLHSSYFA